jgi:hypothetical protein
MQGTSVATAWALVQFDAAAGRTASMFRATAFHTSRGGTGALLGIVGGNECSSTIVGKSQQRALDGKVALLGVSRLLATDPSQLPHAAELGVPAGKPFFQRLGRTIELNARAELPG